MDRNAMQAIGEALHLLTDTHKMHAMIFESMYQEVRESHQRVFERDVEKAVVAEKNRMLSRQVKDLKKVINSLNEQLRETKDELHNKSISTTVDACRVNLLIRKLHLSPLLLKLCPPKVAILPAHSVIGFQNNNLRPIWNETFKFEVEDLPTQSLFIKVLDDDGVQEAELLGCARFELKNLQPGQLRDLWIPLSKDFQFGPKSSNKYRGEIHLELCYVRSTEDLLTPLASLTTPRSPMSRQLTSLEKLFSTRRSTSPSIKTLMSPSSMQETSVIPGLLSLTVLRADGLMMQKPTKELNSYVRLKMMKSEASLQTRVIHNTCKPEWNSLFHIVVEDALHDMLILEVWNHRLFKEVCYYFQTLLLLWIFLAQIQATEIVWPPPTHHGVSSLTRVFFFFFGDKGQCLRGNSSLFIRGARRF
ncbi:hypothetical protein L7F22_042424 [Adiantum nelumboides]|nr:hypothetical protein [Adiantum nelumboides]